MILDTTGQGHAISLRGAAKGTIPSENKGKYCTKYNNQV